jgi:hypothetical protein
VKGGTEAVGVIVGVVVGVEVTVGVGVEVTVEVGVEVGVAVGVGVGSALLIGIPGQSLGNEQGVNPQLTPIPNKVEGIPYGNVLIVYGTSSIAKKISITGFGHLLEHILYALGELISPTTILPEQS